MPDPNDPNAFPPTNPFGPDEGGPTDDPAHGNRPASGARQASPGDVLSQGFASADNAGDFLGLDTGFDPSQQAEDPSFEMPGSDLTLQDELVDQEDDVDSEDYVFEDDDLEDAPSDEEIDGAVGMMVDEFDDQEQSKSRVGMYLMLIVLLAGGGLAGFQYGPGIYDKHLKHHYDYYLKKHVDGLLGTTEVARGPVVNPTPPRDVPPETTPTDVNTGVADPVDPVATGGDPVDTSVPPMDPGTEITTPSDPIESYVPDATPEVPFEDPVPDPVAGTDTAPTMFDGLKTMFGGSETPLEDPVSVGAAPSGEPFDISDIPVESPWAAQGDLDIIWRGMDVPMDALQSPTRVMTPRVGFVRVHLEAGTVFDGRLFAIGRNRVWIDAEPGRIGLDGDRITQIERMPDIVAQINIPMEGIGSGDQVRVRVPGGALYGRVLKVDGDHVTLTTSGGGRVTIENPQIEPVGTGRAIIVGQ